MAGSVHKITGTGQPAPDDLRDARSAGRRLRPLAGRLMLLALIFSAALSCNFAGKPPAIWFGGDVHLDTLQLHLSKPLQKLLQGAEGIVNLEGPVSALPAPPDTGAAIRLRNSPASIASLKGNHIRLASQVNNHAGDFGDTVREEGIALLRTAGLSCAAAPGQLVVLPLSGGIRLVYAAWNLDRTLPEDIAPVLQHWRSKGDMLAVSFHVSGSPSLLPQSLLREAVHAALAGGAGIIVSHGSHRLAKVERHGDAVIAWGLGNFFFACECSKEKNGLALRIDLEQRGKRWVAGRCLLIPLQAGLQGRETGLSAHTGILLDLLESLGSSSLQRQQNGALLK